MVRFSDDQPISLNTKITNSKLSSTLASLNLVAVPNFELFGYGHIQVTTRKWLLYPMGAEGSNLPLNRVADRTLCLSRGDLFCKYI